MRILLGLIVVTLLLGVPHGAVAQDVRILEASIDGGITPATEDYLDSAIYFAQDQEMSLILLKLDTPGGLVGSMRDMVQAMLASPVPIVVWVTPSGARAASAGTFIVAASRIAVMSPQSTMGAASPVAMGGKNVDSTMAKKVTNDLVSLISGLADGQGRNADWYESAVVDAASISAVRAVREKVVDMIAVDREDLFFQLVATHASLFPEKTSADEIEVIIFEPGIRHNLLSWLLEPQVAYLLLMAGMAGMFFEFTTPGAVFPGVFGGLCLLLALYALAILPTNVAGILLILFAGVLVVLEAFVTSFGMLGLAALAALFFGSTILFEPVPGVGGVPMSLIIITCITIALIMGGCLWLIAKAQINAPAKNVDAMVGLMGVVNKWSGGRGTVLVRGELWMAQGGEEFVKGQKVTVASRTGLRLTVHPLDNEGLDIDEQLGNDEE